MAWFIQEEEKPLHKVGKTQRITVERQTNTKTLHSHTETVHNRKCFFYRKYATLIVKGGEPMPRQPQIELEVITEGEPDILALSPEAYQSFVAQCAERVIPYIARYYKRKEYTSKDPKKK